MAEVLVIDDDIYVLNSLERVLQRAGYGVRTARSGTEGIAQIDAGQPDLILMDLLMPGMDGKEFTAALSARGLQKRIPLIVMSGWAPDAGAAKAMGAAGVLAKPFGGAALLDKIQAVVNAAAAGTAYNLV